MDSNEKVLGVINGSTEDELIEVVQGDEGIQLRSRRWGSGLGWYTEKTVDINEDQLGRLIQILQRANKRSEMPPVENSENASRSVVVPFARKYGT